jgi:hypothetical protein
MRAQTAAACNHSLHYGLLAFLHAGGYAVGWKQDACYLHVTNHSNNMSLMAYSAVHCSTLHQAVPTASGNRCGSAHTKQQVAAVQQFHTKTTSGSSTTQPPGRLCKAALHSCRRKWQLPKSAHIPGKYMQQQNKFMMQGHEVPRRSSVDAKKLIIRSRLFVKTAALAATTTNRTSC